MYKLSPSSLTFDWDSCKYCFYMKVKHGLYVSGIFPSIFTKMGNLTSQFYLGKPSSALVGTAPAMVAGGSLALAAASPTLPTGVVKMREGFVKSMPIEVNGGQCYISGRFDALLEFDDGTYGIIDFKTSDAKEEHAAFYSRQLSAYAYALEHPAPRALSFAPVSRLGLFIVTPDRFEPTPEGAVAFVNRTTWVDVPRDDAAFISLLGEVMAVLDAPAPPASSPECGVCNYRARMREFEGV